MSQSLNTNHSFFLQKAIQLGIKKMDSGCGGPFGALITKDGIIVAEGWNAVTSSNDPTAHAEVQAIRAACHALGTFQLNGCTLYSSCEPCPMCLGAIYWARPEALYFAATREDAAYGGFDDSFIYNELQLPLTDRRIPTYQISLNEGRQAFTLWLNNKNRIHY